MLPKWTVLFNKLDLTRGYLFYDKDADAQFMYDKLSFAGLVPTKRPYHETDYKHLPLWRIA